jgi:hypothetical protein
VRRVFNLNKFQEQILRISGASVHIIPHGGISYGLMFSREVRAFVRSSSPSPRPFSRAHSTRGAGSICHSAC